MGGLFHSQDPEGPTPVLSLLAILRLKTGCQGHQDRDHFRKKTSPLSPHFSHPLYWIGAMIRPDCATRKRVPPTRKRVPPRVAQRI